MSFVDWMEVWKEYEERKYQISENYGRRSKEIEAKLGWDITRAQFLALFYLRW